MTNQFPADGEGPMLRKRTGGSGAAGGNGDGLAASAVGVLEANFTGRATMPSPALYPHQWSWDSACIAIGYSRFDQTRAARELTALFAAQWRNGLLPHIVFSEGANYFPGPEFWQTERSPDAPTSPRTSGIVQPPVHATAALQVYRFAEDQELARAFLAGLFPKLAAWHGYLYRDRDRFENGLIEIWHPWESGMDNSPLWDAALDRVTLTREEVPDYRRVDTTVVDPAERPTNAEYDRYAYFVKLYRDCRYDSACIGESCPFLMHDVLFNSLLVQANRDLAEIAEILGEDQGQYREWADQTARSVDTELWDSEAETYFDVDLAVGQRVPVRSGASFAPLYAGIPDDERGARLLETSRDLIVPVAEGSAVASIGVDDPAFEPARYWRGPVWPMLNWVAFRGLKRYGYEQRAAEVRAGFIELVRREGFWEHYNPLTGRGQGAPQFAWTAGLVLDLLAAGDARS
jgi:glycogen debranching enzyme